MTKSEILEKVKEINETAYMLSRQLQYNNSDSNAQSAANLLFSVAGILDTVESLISE